MAGTTKNLFNFNKCNNFDQESLFQRTQDCRAHWRRYLRRTLSAFLITYVKKNKLKKGSRCNNNDSLKKCIV